MSTFESTALIGLGKVGLPLAAALASRGVSVWAFDNDPVRRSLLAGRDTSRLEIASEKGLAEILGRNDLDLEVCERLDSAIGKSSIVFAVVPTPSASDGSFDLTCVEQVIRDVAAVAGDRSLPLLVVLVSTVSPGSITDRLLPLIESLSVGSVPAMLSFCYSPALIALDNVVDGFLQPDFAFIGEVDRSGADRLEAYYRQLLGVAVPIHRMSAQSVEIAKLALNNFLTLKISFANMIGHLCQATPQADAGQVLDALGKDSRIGPKFLQCGQGFGGPCLPRDNAALAAALVGKRLPAGLPEAALDLNLRHAALLVERLDLANAGTVGIVGLGYKTASGVTIDSFSVRLANELARAGNSVRAYQEQAERMDFSALSPDIVVSDNLAGAGGECDVVVLTSLTDRSAHLLDEGEHGPRIVLLGGSAETGSIRTVTQFGKGRSGN